MGGSQSLIFGISHFLPGGGAGPGRLAAGEDLLRAGRRADGDRRRQGDGREGRRHRLHRAEREPRDRQSRPRGLHDRGRGRAGEVMLSSHHPSCRGAATREGARSSNHRPSSAGFARTCAAHDSGRHGREYSMSDEYPERPAVAVQREGQDRHRHRRVGRVRRDGGEGAGGRRRQCRDLRRRRRDARRRSRPNARRSAARSRPCAVRPSSEANCDAIVDAAVKTFGRVDILVVASGINKVSKIVDQKAGGFPRRDGRQRHAVLADGARRRPADAQAGRRAARSS